MNSKAFNEFWDFLEAHTEDSRTSRIAYELGWNGYQEIMSGWIDYHSNEKTSLLDNEGQLFLILLILEAASS